MSFPRLSRVVFSVGVAALLGSLAGSAHAITYDLVPVGNAGNANHTSGFGAVGYDYQIGKYDVTIGQRGGSYTSGALGGVTSSESRFSWSQGKSEESPEIGFRLAVLCWCLASTFCEACTCAVSGSPRSLFLRGSSLV